MNSHRADDPLKLLKDELGLTLQRARLALESYLEDPTASSALDAVVHHLDQLRGALIMLDRPEAARLVDEMGYLVKDLAHGEVKEPTSAQELVLRLILQMSHYLQGLHPEGHRWTFDFLKLINELRRVRGVGPPAAGEWVGAETDLTSWEKSTPAEWLSLAAQWRPHLQRALLSVLRKQDLSANLERIAAIFNQLKQSAFNEPAYRFWWLAEGLVLELGGGGIELGREVSFVLRDLDQQVKQLTENRDNSFTGPVEQELTQRMVGYLSTSEGGLARLENRLDYCPPPTGLVSGAEQGALAELIPPDTETLQQIAALLQETLMVAKDALDRFARDERCPVATLYAELQPLQQVVNVLTLLNMDIPAALIRLQLEALKEQGIHDRLSAERLIQLAYELILVEDSLDGLVRFAYSQELATPLAEKSAKADEQTGIGMLVDFKIRQARALVAQNVIEDMSLARELATAHIHNVDGPAAWGDLQPILHLLKGALALLDCERAVGLIERLEDRVQALAVGELMTDSAVFMNGFAETMVALEYYLKGLEDGRIPDEDILHHADEQLVRLEELVATAPSQPLAEQGEAAEGEAVDGDQPPSALDLISSIAAPTDLDQELVQVFLQEADEILDASELLLQRWGEDTENAELLNALRREMHTLKGSSRMAGFMVIGDLAHAIESLLDALGSNKITGSARVLDGLRRALDRLHDLRVQTEAGNEIDAADELIDELRQLLQTSKGSTTVPGSMLAEPAAPTELDYDLVQTFLQEADEILDASELLLQRWGEDTENAELLNALRREMHTLKGSSRMAGFMVIGDLAHAIESLLDALGSNKITGSARVLDGLRRALDRLHDMVARGKKTERIDAADDVIAQIKGLWRTDMQAAKPTSPVSVAPQDAKSAMVPAKGMGTDTVRVGARLLDGLINQMGESSIYRARIEQRVDTFGFNLTELGQIVSRLRQQLRRLEIETESQILFRYEKSSRDSYEGFDPLELDRFSELQQLSRSLVETVDDLSNIQDGLEDQIHEIGFLVDQQAKVNKEIQRGLMRTQMVRFDSIMSRLRRTTRQVCQELGKQSSLLVEGSEAEVERAMLENIIAPLEHLLRNAIAHGIEAPDRRQAAGKPETGAITLALSREGSELVLRVSDDGAGLDFQAIRAKAESLGWLRPEQPVSEQELIALLLRPGFSTAAQLTQIAGRGVGLDVLNDAVKAMRGVLQIQSRQGQGTNFIVRLPFSLAVTKALLVRIGDRTYAVPALGVEAVTRLRGDQWRAYLAGQAVEHQYREHGYAVHSMGMLLGGIAPQNRVDPRPPVLLFHSAEASAALQVEAVLGSQEIVVKPVAPPLLAVPGISGATVLGDGRVVIVLELSSLVRHLNLEQRQQVQAQLLHEVRQQTRQTSNSVLIVDDSITMRKVTARLLERHHIDTATAKDGMDAVALLEERVPDLVILDIEMPRMDGYELIAHIRSQPHLRHLPLIVVTSRSGQKHRERAERLGIDDYLSKPYQEEQLLESVWNALGERRTHEAEVWA